MNPASHAPVSLKDRFEAMRDMYRTSPGEFWYRCLFWSFWLHLAFFALGYGFREVIPVINAIFLVLYYRHNWKDSVLRRLPVLPLFFCFWIMIVLGVVFSMQPFDSFLHAGMGINKGYIVPFIAMECVRSLRDLKRLVVACVVALFWEGIDGVWQWFTGYDFIMGYPLAHGRLTSSLDDYWVGNYVAMVLVPAFGFVYMLRRHMSAAATAFAYILVFWPAYFLFVGAAARAGFFALTVTAFLWFFVTLRSRTWILVMVPLVILCVVLFLQVRPNALNILQDGRWSLWSLAIAVFMAHPVFGAGIWQYNHAFVGLGLRPARDAITIVHPHNIYLDLLCSHGIVGTALGFIFLFGMLWWGLRHLLPRLERIAHGEFVDESPESERRTGGLPGRSAMWWQLTGLFFFGYVAWLLDGVFGHDFYRIWWFSLAMTFLGIGLGGICRGLAGESLPDAAPDGGGQEEAPKPGQDPAATPDAGDSAAGQAPGRQ